jgi:hypothetical protein
MINKDGEENIHLFKSISIIIEITNEKFRSSASLIEQKKKTTNNLVLDI